MTGNHLTVSIAPLRVDDGRARRTALLSSPRLGSRELWYETDAARADLFTDRADPFAVGALILALAEGSDLEIDGAPVDATLLRNLDEFTRVWESWFDYPRVAILADATDAAPPSGDAVVAFSGGADSAFSAWWHARGDGGGRPLRGAMMIRGIDIPLTDGDGFTGAHDRSRRMTDDLGLDLVVVATNAWTLPVPIGHYTGAGVAACLNVLGGGYGAGLIPSTATYRNLVVPLNSSPVSDWMLGGAGFAIVHDAARYNRLEKLRALAGWPEALRSLRVCLEDPHHDRNCGRCHKCMMTQTAFRLLDVDAPCFDRPPSPEETAAWARTLPSARYYLQEGMVLVDAARARGVDEPWVRVMHNRIRVARLKDGVRAAWPGLADGVASVHRRVTRRRPRG